MYIHTDGVATHVHPSNVPLCPFARTPETPDGSIRSFRHDNDSSAVIDQNWIKRHPRHAPIHNQQRRLLRRLPADHASQLLHRLLQDPDCRQLRDIRGRAT
jgi:hypothetical protein